MAAIALAQETVWLDKPSYDKAECLHYERLAKESGTIVVLKSVPYNKCHVEIVKTGKKHDNDSKKVTFVEKSDNLDIEDKEALINNNAKKHKAKEAKEKKNRVFKKHKSKEEAKNVAEVQEEQEEEQFPYQMDGIAAHAKNSGQEITSRVATLEKENLDLRNIVEELKNIIDKLDARVKAVEEKTLSYVLEPAVCPVKPEASSKTSADKDDDDDDLDLFGSDSEGEDAEAAKIREERLAAYAAKKSTKPVLIAKSNIIFDVKPWSDETDMDAMNNEVRKIESDGLLWGASKFVPLAFGIHKLQISCVVEDDKVSVDWLTEKIQEIESYVQSVDIAAFNKV
ncbi:probable elongation factor 1-delta isoform X2 [Orussus abietinus]|uniref:probable elongation factor 1-delta isoform X2 n=1 Tax=Orussus abietinus TaxID=222816 RepID=UPI0006258F9A|nr:probable elongation factor 1-delta isoform X2 [Orussus abietinus]